MSLNTYNVPPFSGKNRRKNEERLKDGETPCAICGKAVKEPFEHPVVIVKGGGDWARTQEEAEDINDPGHMGVWGVGPDCHRRHLNKEALA